MHGSQRKNKTVITAATFAKVPMFRGEGGALPRELRRCTVASSENN